jgi:hypothetical protein
MGTRRGPNGSARGWGGVVRTVVVVLAVVLDLLA